MNPNSIRKMFQETIKGVEAEVKVRRDGIDGDYPLQLTRCSAVKSQKGNLGIMRQQVIIDENSEFYGLQVVDSIYYSTSFGMKQLMTFIKICGYTVPSIEADTDEEFDVQFQMFIEEFCKEVTKAQLTYLARVTTQDKWLKASVIELLEAEAEPIPGSLDEILEEESPIEVEEKPKKVRRSQAVKKESDEEEKRTVWDTIDHLGFVGVNERELSFEELVSFLKKGIKGNKWDGCDDSLLEEINVNAEGKFVPNAVELLTKYGLTFLWDAKEQAKL